ncbi:hypothetical protein B6I21_07480 [candidate division KSB1 bacterium 4572_119]|nr:MAG: hypothetical protein B6I21_07480 [candidate division KSB1 bacterium 4572_119]
MSKMFSRNVLLKASILFVLCFLLTGMLTAQQRSPGKSHGEESFYVNWKHYHNFDEMTTILQGLAEKFPRLAKLTSSGKSRQGRDLWIMEISNFESGKSLDKPGFYIDGDIHGNEVNGMMVPLYTCWYLLTRYGNDKFVTGLLDRIVFYVRPSVNPDAGNSFISEPNTMHHPRWNYRPIDNDGDGLFDEDPEEDLNGDGEISSMRKRDPHGRYKPDPEDPRLMVRVKDNDPPGGWTLLGTEGIDNDNDGRLNEDIPGGLDMARNFPYDYSIRNGWPYPLSEPETRGCIEFFRDHPNINGVFHYHNTGSLIMMALGKDAKMGGQEQQSGRRRYRRGPQLPEMSKEEQELMKNFLNVTVERDRMRDAYMYQILAVRGVHILKYRPTLNGGVGQFPPWTYSMYGAPSFLIELWGIPADYDGDGRVSQKEGLRWVDEELDGEGWVNWQPYKHPQFGDIEIGGSYTKFMRRTPPGRYLEEHCLKNTRFHLYVASELPKLEITKAEFKPLYGFSASGSGKKKVVKNSADLSANKMGSGKGVIGWLDIEVRNFGVIPTATAQAVKVNVVRPDKLKIEGGKNFKILGRSDPENRLGKVADFEDEKSNEIEIGYIGGRSGKNYRLLVKLNSSKKNYLTLTVDSQRGGKIKKKIPVKFL